MSSIIVDCPFDSVQHEYVQRVKDEYPGLPCFIYGHSTGGAVALKVKLSLFNSDKPWHFLLCDVYCNNHDVFLLLMQDLNSPCLLCLALTFVFLCLIEVQAALQPEVIESLEGGIILTSPAVRVKAAHPVIGVLGLLRCYYW